MRPFFSILLFFIFITTLHAQNEGFDQEKLSKIKNYRSTQLENGLTIICLTTQDSSQFFIRSFTNVPEYVEKDYQAALSIHTELRKNKDFELPSPWSISGLKKMDIELDKDENGFFATCKNNNLDTTMYLFSAIFQKPVVKASEIEDAKKRILARVDSLKDSPTDKIDKITKSIIYGRGHPLQKKPDPAKIVAVNSEFYQDFYDEFHKPGNSYLLVMGNISLDSVTSLANKALGDWKKKSVKEAAYQLIPIEEPKIVFFDTLPTGSKNIKILFPFALHPFTFNAEKAELMSALFQDLLSEKLINNFQLASKIDARFESDKITGNYQLNVKLTKDSINQVIEQIISTISDVTRANYTEEDLNSAKREIIDQFKQNKTTDQYLSWLIIFSESNNLASDYYAEFIEDINKVDKKAMQTFAIKYLNYATSLVQIHGFWYESLNDFIKLCKKFRIELYKLDGKLLKVIPKGFNGFSVINNYVKAVGSKENLSKIKDVSIYFGAIYELPDKNQLMVEGEMLHKDDDRYFTERRMIRPDKDTIFMHQQIFNNNIGLDSTMQGKKKLIGRELQLLKYKSPFVPEMQYQNWQYKAKLVKSVEVDSKHTWVVVLENPEKQIITDFYGVDNGLRYKRVITDSAFFKERIIQYRQYVKNEEKELLYPHLKIITSGKTTIKMVIRKIDYKSKIDKKLFDIEE